VLDISIEDSGDKPRRHHPPKSESARFNELADRNVAGDKNGHPGGDDFVAIVVVLIVVGVWEFVAARRSSRPS
jgi:hypothetical protein